MSARAKAVDIVPYSNELRSETIAFFERMSPDHPELARGSLLDWQHSQRYLALFQKRIVGHIARIPQRFRRDGSDIELGWAATLVLDTSLPLVQTFAGTALLDQLTGAPEYRFAAVGVVPEIEQTHRRRGYTVNRTAVKMYARFLRPSAMLRYVGRSTMLAPPIAIVNMLRPAAKPSAHPQVRRIREFEQTWDSCWQSMLDKGGQMFGVRTAEYLNYKLSQPGKEYSVLVHDGPQQTPNGYVVYRTAINEMKGLKLLKIVDLAGTTDVKSTLLAQATAEAAQSGVDGVVALDSSAESRLYAKAGLWAQRAFPVVIPPDLDGDMRVTFLDSDLDDLW